MDGQATRLSPPGVVEAKLPHNLNISVDGTPTPVFDLAEDDRDCHPSGAVQ